MSAAGTGKGACRTTSVLSDMRAHKTTLGRVQKWFVNYAGSVYRKRNRHNRRPWTWPNGSSRYATNNQNEPKGTHIVTEHIMSTTQATILNEALNEAQLCLTGSVDTDNIDRAIRLLTHVRDTLAVFDSQGIPPDELSIGDIIQDPDGHHCFVTGQPWVSGIDTNTIVIPTDSDDYPVITAYRFSGIETK